jgi:hypothetical protein
MVQAKANPFQSLHYGPEGGGLHIIMPPFSKGLHAEDPFVNQRTLHTEFASH